MPRGGGPGIVVASASAARTSAPSPGCATPSLRSCARCLAPPAWRSRQAPTSRSRPPSSVPRQPRRRLLARYAYTALRSKPKHTCPRGLRARHRGRRRRGGDRGHPRRPGRPPAPPRSRATSPTPRPGHLTATEFAEVAERAGPALRARGRGLRQGSSSSSWAAAACSAVNAGSAEEPRMIKLRYAPARRADRAAHRARRQGHHVRLGRHQPQAVRRDAPADEDGHGGRRRRSSAR